MVNSSQFVIFISSLSEKLSSNFLSAPSSDYNSMRSLYGLEMQIFFSNYLYFLKNTWSKLKYWAMITSLFFWILGRVIFLCYTYCHFFAKSSMKNFKCDPWSLIHLMPKKVERLIAFTSWKYNILNWFNHRFRKPPHESHTGRMKLRKKCVDFSGTKRLLIELLVW